MESYFSFPHVSSRLVKYASSSSSLTNFSIPTSTLSTYLAMNLNVILMLELMRNLKMAEGILEFKRTWVLSKTGLSS